MNSSASNSPRRRSRTTRWISRVASDERPMRQRTRRHAGDKGNRRRHPCARRRRARPEVDRTTGSAIGPTVRRSPRRPAPGRASGGESAAAAAARGGGFHRRHQQRTDDGEDAGGEQQEAQRFERQHRRAGGEPVAGVAAEPGEADRRRGEQRDAMIGPSCSMASENRSTVSRAPVRSSEFTRMRQRIQANARRILSIDQSQSSAAGARRSPPTRPMNSSSRLAARAELVAAARPHGAPRSAPAPPAGPWQ